MIDGKPIRKADSRTVPGNTTIRLPLSVLVYRYYVHVYTRTPKYSISNNSLHNYKSILRSSLSGIKSPHQPLLHPRFPLLQIYSFQGNSAGRNLTDRAIVTHGRFHRCNSTKYSNGRRQILYRNVCW